MTHAALSGRTMSHVAFCDIIPSQFVFRMGKPLVAGGDTGSTALQPLMNLQLPHGVVRDVVESLLRQGVVSATDLVQHPNGHIVLSQAVLQQFPQKAHLWQLARQGCVTGSS